MNQTSSSRPCSRHCSARMRWPRWMGSKVPPYTPIRMVELPGFRLLERSTAGQRYASGLNRQGFALGGLARFLTSGDADQGDEQEQHTEVKRWRMAAFLQIVMSAEELNIEPFRQSLDVV